ncbi:MAG: cofactor-independent phosphoglycerate mutase [Dehalococcoidales bacterium]|nr:cofactor-independent phosphoglycerate mutase [Dehalococcoidales bacterium]
MKFVVVIMDGAAGLPLPARGNQTCLELARTPNLDAMAAGGYLGLARTVPPGMEPSSAVACMSVLGYDPQVYYRGRAAIEARAMGIAIGAGEVVFRCNLVTVQDGVMRDYSAGHISTPEAKDLIAALRQNLGGDTVQFYPGVSYRHICKLKGQEDSLKAVCTPPHDIPGKTVAEYLPKGSGSQSLLDLMERSKAVLRDHPVNKARQARGLLPATQIWLFWGTGQLPPMPAFKQYYGVSAALTSAVDLLRGLAMMAEMDVLQIKGVTDGNDNDYAGQAEGALKALRKHDLVVIHVEAPDEAGHGGNIDEKIEALERIDEDVIGRLRSYKGNLRVLVMPDHPTPIAVRTHTPDPVPFLLWGEGFQAGGARRFTEAEAGKTGIILNEGYKIMAKLVLSR